MEARRLSSTADPKNGTDAEQQLVLGSCEEINPDWKAFMETSEPRTKENAESLKEASKKGTQSSLVEDISVTSDARTRAEKPAADAADCASDLDEDETEAHSPSWVDEIGLLHKDRLTLRDDHEYEEEMVENEIEGSTHSQANSFNSGSVEDHSQVEKCDSVKNETSADDSDSTSLYSEDNNRSEDDSESVSEEKSSVSVEDVQAPVPALELAPDSASLASIELGDGESVESKNTTDRESHGRDSSSTLSPSISTIWSEMENEESIQSDEETRSLEYNQNAAMESRAPERSYLNEIRVKMGYEADDEETETDWRLEAWQRRKELYVSLWVEDVNRALFPHLVEQCGENHNFTKNEEVLAELTPPTDAILNDAPRASTNSERDQESHMNDSEIACGFESEVTASTYEADNEESGKDTSSDGTECGQFFRIKSSKIDERGYEADNDGILYEEQLERWMRWKQRVVSHWVDDVHQRMFPRVDHSAAGMRGRLRQVWTSARRLLRRCIPRCCMGNDE